jgi:hypothetical protein
LRIGRPGADVEEHVRVLEAPPVGQVPPQGRGGTLATPRSRLERIMAAHAAAAAAAAAGDPDPSANESDPRSTPAGSP